MAKGKRRNKVLAAKAKRKALKAESFKRRETDGPNPNSAYGQRQLRRMNGAPMAKRDRPPWWATNKLIMQPDIYGAELGRKEYHW